MLQTAMELADKLNIKDNQDVIVHIKRLPPSFSQKGMHLRQVITDGVIDENEAYLLEKTLLDT